MNECKNNDNSKSDRESKFETKEEMEKVPHSVSFLAAAAATC